MNTNAKIEVILKYFTHLNAKQKEQFAQLENLYSYWNERINLISRKDIDKLYTHHVLHSLSIAKLIAFKEGTKIMDVGCGGGFPGIPLAILFPQCHFFLVDSIGKKIKVVDEIATALELKNLNCKHVAVQQIQTQFDFIVSRAVTAFPKFVNMVSKNCLPHNKKNTLCNGILYLKGGDFQEEISKYGKLVRVFNCSDFFEEEYFNTKKIIHLSISTKKSFSLGQNSIRK